MLTRTMQLLCLAVAISALFMGGSSASAQISRCNVADLQMIAPTSPWALKIASATDTPAAPPIPEYCDVVGYVTTNGEGAGPGSAGIEIGIPASGQWNGKYLFVGNGGLGSGLSEFASEAPAGLANGYAVATTDMGHPNPSGNPFYGAWALLAPGVPNTPALVDYYYRATHQTALVGKQFVQAFYEGRIKRSYYQGCSTGGRQGLVEAERYPDDFDGIIAGDPVAGFAHQAPTQTGAEFAFLRPCTAWVPPSLLPVVDAAIYAKCDPTNVGVLQDPLGCSFDPRSLLCTKSSAPGTCLSQDQVNGLLRYAGPELDQEGNVLMPGYPLADFSQYTLGLGPVLCTLGLSQPSCSAPEPWAGGPLTPIHWAASDGTFPYFVFLTETYNQQDFPISFVNNKGVVQDWALFLNDYRTNLGDATYPSLIRNFIDGKRKMILYHGFSDALITPYQTIQLYNDMATVSGGFADLQNDVRLFMVPGMYHCGGGPGPNTFDMLTALDQWVENGTAPDGIVATGSPTANCPETDTVRTMPLCKYPEMATYKGSGDICNEANWTCDPSNKGLLTLGTEATLAGFPFSYLSQVPEHWDREW